MAEELRKQIGGRIREARERLHLTQQDLAEKLGKTQNTVASYESGTRTIRVTELPALSLALKVPIAYFFGEDFVDQEMATIVSQLTPPFREGVLIVLRQQLELQERLLAAVGSLTTITPEALQKAGEIVEANQEQMKHEIREEFTRIMMERLFGSTE